jgi:hypothetical protein
MGGAQGMKCENGDGMIMIMMVMRMVLARE